MVTEGTPIESVRQAHIARAHEYTEISELLLAPGETAENAIDVLRNYSVLAGVTMHQRARDGEQGFAWSSCKEKGRRLCEMCSTDISEEDRGRGQGALLGLVLPRVVKGFEIWFLSFVAHDDMLDLTDALRAKVFNGAHTHAQTHTSSSTTSSHSDNTNAACV